MKNFHLQAFAEAQNSFRIEGRIARHDNCIFVCFQCDDPQNILHVSQGKNDNQRLHGLWQETCFEVFWAHSYHKKYWELNCTPYGAWNIYIFDEYRQNMREADIRPLQSKYIQKEHQHFLEFQFQLDPSLHNTSIAVGLSAVLVNRNGEKTYWALKHCGKQADFHDRESFILNL